MKKLTINHCKTLAPLLRQIVERHDSQKRVDLAHGPYSSGICYAAQEIVGRRGEVDAYMLVDVALDEIQQGWKGGYLNQEHYGWADLKGWEQRAIMCCLMAEWLEERIAVTPC